MTRIDDVNLDRHIQTTNYLILRNKHHPTLLKYHSSPTFQFFSSTLFFSSLLFSSLLFSSLLSSPLFYSLLLYSPLLSSPLFYSPLLSSIPSKAFGLLHVPPPAIPTVTLSLRHRTEQVRYIYSDLYLYLYLYFNLMFY